MSNKVEKTAEEIELSKKLIPDRTEVVVILDDYKEGPNKKGTGKRGTLELSVIQRGGEFHNKKLYVDINPENPNEKAVEISNKLLDSFLKSTGECPNGLADINYDRTKIIEFKGYKVVADMRQRMEKEYTNSQGVKVPAKLKNQVYTFKSA